MQLTKQAINEVFPLKRVTRKHAELIQRPWLTTEIINEGKFRDELQKKAIESKLPGDWAKFRKSRNKVNKMCRDAKKDHFNKDCEKSNGDSSKMWKSINRAMNKKPKQNTYPDYIETKTADGEIKKVRNKTEIANEMNRQFTQMGSKLANKLGPTNAKFSDYLKSPNKSSFFIKSATETEVGKIFKEIGPL